MPVNRNPTVRQRRLGRMLRDARTAAGKTIAHAAAELDCAESKISRIEAAQSGIRSLDLRALLDFYDVTDKTTRARFQDLARNGRERGWWSQYEGALNSEYSDYIALEWDASDVYAMETAHIPGLLQTPAYTEAVVRMQNPEKPDDEVAAQVKVRGQRRQVFARSTPLRLWAIITEAALKPDVGKDVMRDQLEALVTLARETNIQIQVLPSSAAINVALYGPFGILTFPEPVETDIVYADNLMSIVYYEEPKQVEFYTTLFRRLNTEALPVEQSLSLIREHIKETD
ncbi:transcriptional regulator with XRE-family HTH domain [Streptomyces canus]|uniref:Transcriptional regulator with XRE-family HTH domain n=1 Tax=Streptomyces canus TaxID=58343 RepID=A0AAW8FCB7_9ACTN|nr:helix-turn-helix transcriptional regulator [Streptomyces canus]MDQ0907776.1 transcriptional regulator with XRE-family HTH domain [Streptomyces canus]